MNTGITHHLFYEQTDKIFTIALSGKKIDASLLIYSSHILRGTGQIIAANGAMA
jgi:hypothetical protein